MASRRIAVVVTDGTAAGFYAGVLAALQRAGAAVRVFSAASEYARLLCAQEGVEHCSLDLRRAPSIPTDFGALLSTTAQLRRFKPHLVDAGTPKAALLGMLAARALRVPVRVHTLHGLRYEAAGGVQRRILFAAQRLSSRAATHTLCVGPSLRRRAEESGLLAPGEGVVLGDGSANGVDTAHFADDEATRRAGQALRRRHGIGSAAMVFGFAGRLASDKGLGELEAAWRLRGHEGHHLLLAGEIDPTDPPSAEVLARLRARADITFLGAVGDMRAFYAAIDVLVLPSYREGFPTVCLEAAAMQRPIITTNATGCIDAVIDGQTGLQVPVRDPRALATALDRYAADEALRRRQGEAGCARVRAAFSRERVVGLKLDWYATLLDSVPR